MRLRFAQLTLLAAAYAAKSSIWAKRPMSENDKTSQQASLRRVLPFSAAWLNSYKRRCFVKTLDSEALRVI